MAHDDNELGYGRRGGEEPQGGPLHDDKQPTGPKGYESQKMENGGVGGATAANWDPAASGAMGGQSGGQGYVDPGGHTRGQADGFGAHGGQSNQAYSGAGRDNAPSTQGASGVSAGKRDHPQSMGEAMDNDADVSGSGVGGGLTPVSGAADHANERTAPGIGGENHGVDKKDYSGG